MIGSFTWGGSPKNVTKICTIMVYRKRYRNNERNKKRLRNTEGMDLQFEETAAKMLSKIA